MALVLVPGIALFPDLRYSPSPGHAPVMSQCPPLHSASNAHRDGEAPIVLQRCESPPSAGNRPSRVSVLRGTQKSLAGRPARARVNVQRIHVVVELIATTVA